MPLRRRLMREAWLSARYPQQAQKGTTGYRNGYAGRCGYKERGWANYYGRYYPSALKRLWWHVNDYLVRWMQRKYKRLAHGVTRAARALGRLAERDPRSFVHWERGFAPRAR